MSLKTRYRHGLRKEERKIDGVILSFILNWRPGEYRDDSESYLYIFGF